ncbi:MAG: hypothetical protein IPP88_16315 [Betaproteobacteria bacterium]|nr:hypothetical protein [Betaproteobacteria bacterium]
MCVRRHTTIAGCSARQRSSAANVQGDVHGAADEALFAEISCTTSHTFALGSKCVQALFEVAPG